MRALEFLASHPLVKLPFVVHPISGTTVFHALCNHGEFRRTGADDESWLACFKILAGVFPGASMLNRLDKQRATPLHYAIRHANPLAVETLLKHGADPITMETTVAGALEAFANGTAKQDDYGPMPPVMLAKLGLFFEIPDYISSQPEECAKWLYRRRRVTQLMEPYLFEFLVKYGEGL